MYVIYILLLCMNAEGKRHFGDVNPSLYKSLNEHTKSVQALPEAVNFGHVFRDGFEDTRTPDDTYDLSEINNQKELVRYSKNPLWAPKPENLKFLSPRDEIQYNPEVEDIKELITNGTQQSRLRRPTWYDFSTLLERNLANPNSAGRRPETQTTYDRKINKADINARINTSEYFEENAFYMRSKKFRSNWTSCEEFARRGVFHPDDVVNTKWLPFYIWSTRGFVTSFIHKFSYPTKKIVQYYKTTFQPYIRKMNWYEPKLLLRERREILLIAGDRRGLFFGIPNQETPTHVSGANITLPILTLRMKIVDPYLALMYCDERYAVIMAEDGTGPDNDKDKTLEASTLGFRGKGSPARRDFKGERLEEDLMRKKKVEADARKMIRIENPFKSVGVNFDR